MWDMRCDYVSMHATGERWLVYKGIREIIHVSIKTTTMRGGDARKAKMNRNPESGR